MKYDFIIIGGGILGLATAKTLLQKYPYSRLLLLEKDSDWASHQTGRNSGVIHSGIYYKPGSLKAKLAKSGGSKLIEFCKENNITYDICGKLIIATEKAELENLNNLYERGLKNGLSITKIGKEEITEKEPYANGIEAIHVPMAGIVNYKQVSLAFVKVIQEKGGVLKKNAQVKNIIEKQNEVVIETANETYHGKYFINCGGLFSDRIAKRAGLDPRMKIIPFRGEYFELKKEKTHLVKNLIYPVPNPEFPFLGVHLTRMIDGHIHAGPNAVLAFKREGYNKTDINVKDLAEVLTYKPFWQIAKKHFKYGMMEIERSLNKDKFVRALQRLVPAVQKNDLIPSAAGVRAQALTVDGKLIDDFIIVKGNRSIHVCNAPSPAATASLAIGEQITEYLEELQSFQDC